MVFFNLTINPFFLLLFQQLKLPSRSFQDTGIQCELLRSTTVHEVSTSCPLSEEITFKPVATSSPAYHYPSSESESENDLNVSIPRRRDETFTLSE